MKYSIILMTAIYSNYLWAHEQSSNLKNSTQLAIKAITEINTPLITNCLNNPADASNPFCASITDNFCNKLWQDSSGNIKTFDGQIMAGNSTKSELSLAAIYNDKVLISSLDRLPNDIKKHLSPAIKALEKVLKVENKSNKWMRDYSRVKTDFDNALEDLVDERYNKLGLIKTADYKKWQTKEKIAYSEVLRSTEDEIIKAKYANHPNWKRVENAYEKALVNLVDSLTDLKIPEEKKEELKAKIRSVKLTLPLLDPTKAGDKDCANNQVNAFYSPYTNHFTVCAGYFNSYQSESALLFVITHELGHAIDSERQAKDQWLKESPLANKLSKLVNKKNQTYSCNEWNAMNKDLFVNPKEFTTKSSAFDKLYQCLREGQKIDEFELSKVTDAASQQLKKIISYYADNEKFSTLLKKEQEVDGKNINSEFYYDPTQLQNYSRGHIEKDQQRDASPLEVFMQNFHCILEENQLTKKTFEMANKETRSKIFEEAIEKTSKAHIAARIDYFTYCGKNCEDLTIANLSFDISEKMADWMANKSFSSYLKSLAPNNREEASALATSLFCSSEKQISAELSLSEKKFSLESHPDYRHRRVSLYTPATSQLINCQTKEEEKGDSQCQP